MKTSFNKLTHLVLSSTDTDKIIAILECQAGDDISIKDRLIQAIREDLDAETVLVDDFDIDPRLMYDPFEFSAKVLRDGDWFYEDFYLTSTQMY
jgi:hypothetical protein